MAKQIAYGADARKALKSGIDQLACSPPPAGAESAVCPAQSLPSLPRSRWFRYNLSQFHGG